MRLTGQVDRGSASQRKEAGLAALGEMQCECAKHCRQIRFGASRREIGMKRMSIDPQLICETTQSQSFQFIGSWCV